jgi:hypothetical protein
MATITDPEATNILDQLGRVQTQLANKASSTDVSTEAASIRTDLTTLENEVVALTNRMVNAQATLLGLEARGKTLEDA